MKVALITENFNSSLGGAETSISELFNEISSRDIDVTILAAASNIKDDDKVVALCQDCSSKRVPVSLYQRRLKQYLKDNHFDIVHSFLPFDFADIYQPRLGCYAEAVKRYADSFENKFMVKFKSVTSWMNFRRNTWAKAERNICTTGGKIVVAALSEMVKENFKDNYNMADDRIKVIVNGIKTDKLSTGEIKHLSDKISQKGWDYDNGNYSIFLFGGHDFRRKGLRPLLQAMKLAIEAKPATQPCLVIAGKGNISKYQKLAKKYNIEKNITFVGKIDNIKSALSLSNVAVLPSFYDACSRFILEALAVTMPVITTSFNGACDLFTNNRHGKIINCPENIEQLAQAIHFYCDRKNIQKAQEAIINDNLIDKISIKRHVDELSQLYQVLTKS